MVKKGKAEAETYADFIKESKEEESEEEEEVEAEAAAPKATVTMQKLEEVKVKVAESSLSAIRRLLALYRLACRVNDNPSASASLFADSKTFNEVITYTLDCLPPFFHKRLSKQGKDSPHWKALGSPLRNFLACTAALLKQVTQNELLKFVYGRLKQAATVMQLHENYAKKIGKLAAGHWAEGDKGVVLVTYDFLRTLLATPGTDALPLYRRLFLVYISHSVHLTWDNYSRLSLLRSTYTALLGLDLSAAYQVTFQHLRQLALHLLSITKTPTKDALKTLVNWQNLSSLWLLAQCIRHYSKDLGEMRYPLVQICAGMLRLVNSFQHTPFRLHLLRVMVMMESGGEAFIPQTSAYITDLIASPELYKRARHTEENMAKTFEFYTALKVSKGDGKSEGFRYQLVEEICDVVVEHMAVWGRSVGLVEMWLGMRGVLLRASKKAKNPAARGKLQHVIQQIDESCVQVTSLRSTAPIHSLSPLSVSSPLEVLRDRILQTRKDMIAARSEEANS